MAQGLRTVSLSFLWYNIKHINICIIGVPEGEETEQRIENLFEEIMTENLSVFLGEGNRCMNSGIREFQTR